jgi:hypothetical protein
MNSVSEEGVVKKVQLQKKWVKEDGQRVKMHTLANKNVVVMT